MDVGSIKSECDFILTFVHVANEFLLTPRQAFRLLAGLIMMLVTVIITFGRVQRVEYWSWWTAKIVR